MAGIDHSDFTGAGYRETDFEFDPYPQPQQIETGVEARVGRT